MQTDTGYENIPPSVVPVPKMLENDPLVERLILFGSRAIGDHGERSDVDIAVCGKEISSTRWAQIRESAYSARTLFRISLVHFDKNPESLKQRILTTGKSIYVRPEA